MWYWMYWMVGACVGYAFISHASGIFLGVLGCLSFLYLIEDGVRDLRIRDRR